MPDTAFAQLYSAIPPELRAILVQQLLNSGVAAASWSWRRWWYALRKINMHDVLYRQYLEQFMLEFSTIATPTRLVPVTGSLDADKFLLWPELDEEIRSRTAEHTEPDREPSLPRKLKATELLAHPLSNNRLFVVEGEAGVGKTTMARALAHLAAKQALELMGRKGEDGPQVQYLPLYFNAEDLIKLAEDTPVGQINPSGEGALKNLLNAVLQKPNRALLVIVDGLDEVGELVQTKALQRLRSLWIEEGNHRYLVLGRPGSIRGIPWIQGDEGVLKLALRPWGEAEVREFLERWSGNEEAPLLNGDEVDGLIGYIRDRVGLPTPALMVQMVVARYLELRESNLDDVLAQMPETRSKLYQNYLRQLLLHSEGAKPGTAQGGTAQTADQQKRLWLGCLELLLKQRFDLRQRVRNTCSVSDLPDVSREAVLGHSCGDLVDDSTEAERWWEERKLCRLGHESLHEFLAAEALSMLYSGDPEGFWKDWVHPRIFDPYWQQTLIFTMALMNEEDQSALMRGLLALGSCDPISKLTKRHLKVMAKAWGAGVRYNPAILQEWLANDPQPDMLAVAAANASLRITALEVLEQMALEGEDEWVRIDAAQALWEYKPELAIDILESLAQEGENEGVRYWAALTLGSSGPAAINALEQLALEGEDEWVRIDAARSLGELGPVAIPTLERLAQEAKDKLVLYQAVEALGVLRPKALPALKRLMRKGANEQVQIRAAILHGLHGKLGSDFASVLERQAREGKDEEARLRATTELGKLGSVAVPALERLVLKGGSDGVRLNAAVALVEQKPEVAVHALEQLARKGNEYTRFRAAKAVLTKKPELATSTLEQLAREGKNEQVRLWAAEALGELNPELTLPVLKSLAQEGGNELVRFWAIKLLGKLGASATPALEQLALEGADKPVRVVAAMTLGDLGVPPTGCEELVQRPE